MAQRNKGAAKNFEATPALVEGEQLKPIRKVVRELKRPDGTTLRVEVPVYPPFRLKNRAPSARRKTGSDEKS